MYNGQKGKKAYLFIEAIVFIFSLWIEGKIESPVKQENRGNIFLNNADERELINRHTFFFSFFPSLNNSSICTRRPINFPDGKVVFEWFYARLSGFWGSLKLSKGGTTVMKRWELSSNATNILCGNMEIQNSGERQLKMENIMQCFHSNPFMCIFFSRKLLWNLKR